MADYYLVRREHGPAWDASRPRREQDGWDEHAAFMDELAAEGFVVLGGPVGEGDGDYALNVVDAESEEAARILKLDVRENLDMGDCRVEDTFENRCKVAQVIRKHKPQIIFAPYYNLPIGRGLAPDELAAYVGEHPRPDWDLVVPWADGVPADEYAGAGVTWLVQSAWPKDDGWVRELQDLAATGPTR